MKVWQTRTDKLITILLTNTYHGKAEIVNKRTVFS